MPPTRPARLQLLTEVLAWLARGLIFGLLIVAPWPYAMAEWSSQVWLVPVVGAILLLASLVALSRRQSVGNPLVWSLSAVLAIGLLQVAPLPEPLWKMVAPLAGFEQQLVQLTNEFEESAGAIRLASISEAAADDVQQEEAENTGSRAKVSDGTDEAAVSQEGSAEEGRGAEMQSDAERRATLDGPTVSQEGSATESEADAERRATLSTLEDAALRRTLSIDPLQTRATVCVFAMGLAMLLSSIILFRDRLSVSLLLGTLSLSGLAIALVGIYQAVTADNWTFIAVPKDSSFATFYSRNSAPQFLACCFAATGGLLALFRANKSKRDQDKRYQVVYPSVNIATRLRRRVEEFVTDADPLSFVLLIVMLLLFASVLIANSRGGILAFLASGLTVLLVYSLGKQASFSSIVAVLFLVVGAGLFLSLYGLDELVGSRMDTVSREAYQLDNARLKLWAMAFSQPSCWLLGSGLGTFHFALLPVYATPQPTWFYHAENIYVELASGAGMITLLIGLAGLLWLIWQLLSRTLQSNTGRSARFACMFAVLAVALHNLVDFSLILPAVFLPVACLVGTYLGTRHQVRQKVRKSRRSRSSSSSSPKSSSMSRRQRNEWDTTENETDDLNFAEEYRDDRERYAHRRKHHPHADSGRRSLAASASPEDSSEASRSDAPSSDATLESHWAPRTLIVCLLLISAAVGLGYRSLSGFAFAEKLPATQQPESDLVELIRSATGSQWASFPESRLQIGRRRQELARKQLQDSPHWPAAISEPMRQSLSNPEFFNTAFHATPDPELQSLKEFLEQEPSVLKNLADSQADMRAALDACPLDWRASWGILRSDLGEMTDEQRRRNYARILLTCRNHQSVLQAAGTHALMIGDLPAGMEIWRQLLPVSGRARLQVLNLVDRFLTAQQLVAILPENPMQRIELARLARSRADQSQQLVANQPENPLQQIELARSRADSIIAADLLDAVELQRAFEAARFAADWPQVAWCAAQKGDTQREIDAWEEAILDDVYNPNLSYALAQTLQRAGRLEDALSRANEALSRSPSNPQFQKLKEDLTQEKEALSTPK